MCRLEGLSALAKEAFLGGSGEVLGCLRSDHTPCDPLEMQSYVRGPVMPSSTRDSFAVEMA